MYQILNFISEAKDCLDVLTQGIKVNGVYDVQSPSSKTVYPVNCDMTTNGGGWTVSFLCFGIATYRSVWAVRYIHNALI